MARTPPSGEDRSTRRGIGSLPESTEIATFVPASDADKDLYLDALMATNYDPRAVYEQTGLFRAPFDENQIVREISDVNATLNKDALRGDRENLQLQDVLNHPELFEMYPALGEVPVELDDTMLEYELGSFNPRSGRIRINPNSSDEQIFETLMHEAAGHGVQELTGMVPGGNYLLAFDMLGQMRRDHPNYMDSDRTIRDVQNLELAVRSMEGVLGDLREDSPYRRELQEEANQAQADLDQVLSRVFSPDATFGDLPIPLDDPIAFMSIYEALGGEAAARLIPSRANMTEEELRQNYPLDMLDVPQRNIEFVTPYQKQFNYNPVDRYFRDPSTGFEGDN